MSEAILTFQAQLSGIMETVLKTAVFEITWLVESSFQGEVVRSRQEVELLRQRLQVAEGRRSGGEGSASSTCVECGRAAASGRGKERRTSGAQTGVVETCIIKEEKEPERTQSSCLMDQSAEATPPSTRVSKPTYLEGDGFELMQKKQDHKGGVGNHCLKVTVESSAHSYGDEDLLSKGMGELCEDLGQDPEGLPPREQGLKGAPQAHTGWPSSPDSECITFERVTVPGGGDSDGEVCGQGLSHSVGRVAESEQRGDIADRHGIQIESVVSLSRPQHCAANHSRRKTLRRPREAALRHLGPAGRLGQASACQGAVEAQSGVSEMAGSTLCETSFTASSIRTLPDFDVGTGDKQINCMYCGKSFSYISRLKIHLLKHTGEKPFSCTQCGKRFTIARNLERHQHIHWGDATFCCAQCGKRFKRADHLKVHQRVHTGERPYSCTQCNKCFRFSGDLNTHKRVHTGEKPYCCSLCGSRFSQLRQLKAHQRNHKGTGRFDQLIK